MSLPSSGLITMDMVNTELGNTSTAPIWLGDSSVRNLFGKSSGLITLNDGHGKSAIVYVSTVNFLVVAGGGSGGSNLGGGGGAGGVIQSTANVSHGSQYSFNVGGGAGGNSNTGSNSSAFGVDAYGGGGGGGTFGSCLLYTSDAADE